LLRQLTFALCHRGFSRDELLSSSLDVIFQAMVFFFRSCSPEAEMDRRQFKLPWSVEEWASFVVKDAAGRTLAHIHFADEPVHREAAKLLARNDASKIADSILQLPGLLHKHAEVQPPLGVEAQSSEVFVESHTSEY
jgi:hypothetical protein